MKTRIRFHGVAAYEIVTPDDKHILIDPALDMNPKAPIRSHELEKVDVILVSHAAGDHLGDAAAIAKRTGAPVVCGMDVQVLLQAQGIPITQIRPVIWGLQVEMAGILVQPVECHHWSHTITSDGRLLTGVPMGFVVHPEPGVRFYHYGDTAIFSDLKLIAEIYKPTIGCLGITQPFELEEDPCAGKLLTGEMNPREGALAAQWLGLDIVLPCHYQDDPDCDDVREFERYLEEARKRGERVPRSIAMKAGDWITV